MLGKIRYEVDMTDIIRTYHQVEDNGERNVNSISDYNDFEDSYVAL